MMDDGWRNQYHQKVNQREKRGGKPGAGEIVEPAGAGEDDDTNLSITENRKLLGFLQQAVPSLGESHLTTRRVIDPLYRDLSPSHFSPLFFLFLIQSFTQNIVNSAQTQAER